MILVKWNQTQQMFELNEEAVNVHLKKKMDYAIFYEQVLKKKTERRKSKASFVSIAGERRSGKTFLLN